MTIKKNQICTLLTSLSYLLIAFGFCEMSFAQTTNVEFRVNMNYQISSGRFYPDYEMVDIAGTFNGWGNILTPMSDEDSDGIYSVTIDLNIGTTVEFKCRINGEWNGREEFPGGGPNRVYTVVENGVVEFWYSDETPEGILEVKISSSSIFIEPGETIQFIDMSSGNPIQWEWTFPGGTPSSSTLQNPTVHYLNEGTYSVSLTITNEENETASKTFPNFVRVGNMQTHWWNDAVFYEIFVRSFKDSNGDGKGDFQGLIEKLDYLNDGDPSTDHDLGITGIWLMPVQQSPSYHGYDATDYRTIEQDYGSNSDFQTFIQEAHSRGIRVIVDFVMNHSSNQHTWFTQSATGPQSPKRDWYIWKDYNPGTNGPWGQNLWHYSNGYWYYGLFWSGMPDLNYTNQEVKDEMFDVARFWLEEMNVDGFRLDAVKYIIENDSSVEDTPETIEFWKDFRSYYKSVNEDAFAVGEAWTATEIAQLYVNDNALDYCFEFSLADAIISSTNSGNASTLGNRVTKVLSAYPFLQFGTFLTNHDINRIMDILGYDVDKAKVAASILLTLPGIPYIYYGEEIGMTGVKPDENIRTPMQWNSSTHAGFTTGTPWRPVNSDYTYKNVEDQQDNSNSLWQYYRKLIKIRNDQVALRRGNYKPVTSSNYSVLAFLRQYEDENIFVVTNFGSSTATNVSLSLPYGGIATGLYSLYNLMDGYQIPITIDDTGGFPNFNIEQIPGKTVLIYRLQSPSSIIIEKDKDYAVTIYPNPTQDHISVSINGDYIGQVNINIVDLMGRKLHSSSFYNYHSNDTYRVSVEGFPSGIYFLAVQMGRGVLVEKFIVR